MKVRIKPIYRADNWVKGTCSDYSFEAKIYDTGSYYGINNGRVSKLYIKNQLGICVTNYDRGWDIRPENAKDIVAFEAVLKSLESSRKKFEE